MGLAPNAASNAVGLQTPPGAEAALGPHSALAGPLMGQNSLGQSALPQGPAQPGPLAASASTPAGDAAPGAALSTSLASSEAGSAPGAPLMGAVTSPAPSRAGHGAAASAALASQAQTLAATDPNPAQDPRMLALTGAAQTAQTAAAQGVAAQSRDPAPITSAEGHPLAPQALTAPAAAPSASAALPATPVATPAAAQAAEALRHMVQTHANTLTFVLTPPELGRVSIRLRAASGDVQALVRVERPEALDALRPELRALERSLADAAGRSSSVALDMSDGRDGGLRQHASQGDGMPDGAEGGAAGESPEDDAQDGASDTPHSAAPPGLLGPGGVDVQL